MKNPTAVLFSVVLAGGLLGCAKPNETTWSNESKSPDGNWIVLAHTEHTDGGFGTGWEGTIVQLKQSFDGAKPMDILDFDDGPESPTDMQAHWISPSHLQITYRGNPKINFQAIKAFGLDISAERITN